MKKTNKPAAAKPKLSLDKAKINELTKPEVLELVVGGYPQISKMGAVC